jgi:hypothetical protein
MSKETYYFSHDSNALTDTKILNMRADYGMEGYGLYWAIVEMLRNEEEYKLNLNEKTYKAINLLTNTKIDVGKFTLDCIINYELFQSDLPIDEDAKLILDDKNKHCFWSNSLLRRMQEKDRKSEMAREKANARWNRNATAMQQQCSSNANKVKKSKEKKSKINENKINIKEQEEKIHFADFVSMTNVEYEKLVNTYGTGFVNQCITVLDNYKRS